MKHVSIFAFLLLATTAIAEVKMPELRITFPDPIVHDMPYSNGQMTLTDTAGNVITLPAQFKTRGATSQSYLMKPALNMKIRTADYAKSQDTVLLGLPLNSSYILDAMAIDRICMRNRVGFDTWNAFSKLPYATELNGRNGTDGHFLELYINSKYYGIYCLTDKINRKVLDLKKVQKNTDGTITPRGVLYKSGTEDIANQNERGFNEDYTACTVSWHNAWELSEPDDYPSREAWQPLLDAYDEGQSYTYVSQYFYPQQLAEYQIFIMALSIQDNWGNKNHFFSIRNMQADITASPDRRFVVTPWDLDTDLGGAYDGRNYDGQYSDWKPADIMKNGVYPFSVCMGQQAYKDMLREAWVRGREGALSADSVCQRLYDYRDLFIQSGAWKRMTDHFDAEKNKPCYVNDLEKEIGLVAEWYKARVAEMDQYFGISTDIVNIEKKAEESTIFYDLLGRPTRPTAPGIYITNGKKISVLR